MRREILQRIHFFFFLEIRRLSSKIESLEEAQRVAKEAHQNKVQELQSALEMAEKEVNDAQYAQSDAVEDLKMIISDNQHQTIEMSKQMYLS